MKKLNLPWTAIENSWQYTTIYDCKKRPVCRFDLSDLPGLTEDNQELYEEFQRARVQLVLDSVNKKEL